MGPVRCLNHLQTGLNDTRTLRLFLYLRKGVPVGELRWIPEEKRGGTPK